MKSILIYSGTFLVIVTAMTFIIQNFQSDKPLETVNRRDTPRKAANTENPKNSSVPEVTDTSRQSFSRQNRFLEQQEKIDSLETALQLAVQHHKKLREQKEEVAKADQEKQTEAFEKKMRDMAKIYEKMNSEEAAKIISNLEIEIAVSVLVKMRKRKAAKVMENLEPAQAVKISKYMAVQEQ